MLPSIMYYLAIIDPPNSFVDNIEERLTKKLKPMNVLVRGFRDTKKYLTSLNKYPNQIPLIVIADVAALDPTVEKGVFMQTKRVVPRAKCISYTTDPLRSEWQRLIDLHALENRNDIVDRKEAARETKLENVVVKKVNMFLKSDNYKRIASFQSKLLASKRLDNSQTQFLIEAARGTDKGKCLFCESESSEGSIYKTGWKPQIGAEKKIDKSTIEQLLKPNKYISLLISRENLRFWERAILEDVARYKFAKLCRIDWESALSLKTLLDSKEFHPDTEGQRIIRNVCREIWSANKNT